MRMRLRRGSVIDRVEVEETLLFILSWRSGHEFMAEGRRLIFFEWGAGMEDW